MPRVRKDYEAIAAQYSADVLNGTVPACKWVKLAARRHLDDLAKSSDPGYPWVFDQDKADRVLRFIDLCPHIKGKKFVAQGGFKLQPWQVWLVGTAFGWVNKETGLRRFKRVYTEVAKGNGKSPLMSAITIYMAFADDEPGSEVYTAATSTKQARLVFDVSQAMLRKMATFCTRAGIEVEAHSINQLSSNSFIRPLSSEAKGVEGVNPFFIVVDELHAHPSRDLYDNLDTANGKREGSMLWAITTAGDNRSGICYEVRTYLTKVLEKVVDDDSVFGVIYSIDEEDEERWIGNAEVWKKANPNWGICVNPEEIATKAHAAAQMASKQAAFLTKHLNVWVAGYHAWMDMTRLLKCADETLNEDNFAGQPCVVGLDLASKLDLLAKVKVFWKEIEGKIHLYAFGKYWTPEARIEAGINPQYAGWKIDGWLEASPGETNDYDIVEEDIRQDARKFQVLEVCHDPWQAVEMVNHLQRDGIKMVEIKQVTSELSDPMKEFEAAIYDGRFHYNGDPVLAWALSNVVCKPDKNDNLFPTKERPENKIDPATALITALNGVARHARAAVSGTVSAFGNCRKCGKLCIGSLMGGHLTFLCPQHSEAA